MSQVSNGLDGKAPHPASIQTLSFDIDTGSKGVVPSVSTSSTRTMTLTGGTDALGGTDLIHVSSGTTGTVYLGPNTALGTLAVAPGTAGSFNVENYNGVLDFGPASVLTGNVNLTKTGAGKLILEGSNTLGAGVTFTISAGTVLANTEVAETNSATGAANVSVLAGATLGGSGQITPGAGNRIVVAAGGTLAPGDGLGTLTVNGQSTTVNGRNTMAPLLSLAVGAKLKFELDSSEGDSIALVNGAQGDIAFGGNVIDFNNISAGTLPDGSYILFSAASANDYAGLTHDSKGFITGGLTVGAGLEGYTVSLQLIGGNIVLNVASPSTPPVPVP
jgi:autotransporter-associated beta strand protein